MAILEPAVDLWNWPIRELGDGHLEPAVDLWNWPVRELGLLMDAFFRSPSVFLLFILLFYFFFFVPSCFSLSVIMASLNSAP